MQSGKKFAEKRPHARNDTTRYGRFEKKLARFCDFLLTPTFRRLILRIQIRGTWKRQTDQESGNCLGSALPTLQPGITVKNERVVIRSAEFVGRSECCSVAWQVAPTRAAHSLFAVVSGDGELSRFRSRAAAQASGAAPLSDKGVHNKGSSLSKRDLLRGG